MKPPPRIHIGPHTHAVEYDPDLYTSGEFGKRDGNRARITLCPGQSPTILRDTLLHEVLHGVLDVTGIAHELGDEKEERYVRRLTPALLDLLRRNPRLVALLTEAA